MALAIAGGGAAFLVLGVAAVSWRTQCEANPKAGICFLSAPPAPGSITSVVAKRAEPVTPAPLPVAEEPATDAILTAAITQPVVEATLSQPAPAEADLVAAAEMMSSTFATLSDLSAEINGSDPAPDPLQTAVAATVGDPSPAVPAPATAPTKRTVKLIPVSPTGTPVSAATAAIDAADQVDVPHAVALQQASTGPGALAFTTPAGAVAAGSPARVLEVNDNLVSVRAGPSTSDERLFVLEEGDEVKQLAVAGDWIQIEDAEGRSGWMLGAFLADDSGDAVVESVAATTPQESILPKTEPAVESDAVAETPAGGDIRRVIGGGVNVRAAASSSGEKIFTLGPGEEVTVSETQRGWLKITDDQGRTGWLYKDFVTGG